MENKKKYSWIKKIFDFFKGNSQDKTTKNKKENINQKNRNFSTNNLTEKKEQGKKNKLDSSNKNNKRKPSLVEIEKKSNNKDLLTKNPSKQKISERSMLATLADCTICIFNLKVGNVAS